MINKSNRIQIEYIKTDLLKPYPQNPRFWDGKGKDDLKRSIQYFGWTSPLLVNMAPGREFIVLSGNLRLEVAQDLGFKEVPCVKVEVKEIEKEKEILLRMNVLNGDWDFELLKDFDIDIAIKAGFKEINLSSIWDSALGVEDDTFDFEKERQKITEPKVKPGEIYALGNHVLGCGDSTDVGFVKKVLGNEKVDVVYCDPLFNIDLSYDKGLSNHSKYGGKANDQKTDSEYKGFLKKTINNALAVSKPDTHVFYYCDQNYIGLIQELFQEVGLKNRRVCLWIKNGFNVTPQVAFNKGYEPCVYSTRGEPYLAPIKNLGEVLNKEIASGNRTIDDIIDIFDIWLARRLPSAKYEHPTEKPPTLHEKPLKRCSKVNDIVLDLFAGSGSTLISCEQLKRRCFTIDIDPIFCDLVIRRFENLTGIKAKLLTNIKEKNGN